VFDNPDEKFAKKLEELRQFLTEYKLTIPYPVVSDIVRLCVYNEKFKFEDFIKVEKKDG
jgi:hypothetical protein